MASQNSSVDANAVPNGAHTKATPVNGSSSANVAYETDVLIAGGGPVGMVTAYRLSQLGQSCMMIEQSQTTTPYPKMEFLSTRSMEIFRKMGLADRLRGIAVPEKYSFNEVYSTGFGGKDGKLHTLERPSPAELRETYRRENDGTRAQEPWMRLSQIVFEAWMKPVIQAEPLIDDHWGCTFKTLEEHGDHVLSTVTDAGGKDIVIKSKYVVGCDGTRSPVRKAAGLEAKRTSLPFHSMQIHFKVKNLEQIYSQGQFWHLIFLTGALMTSQDEESTFTVNKMLGPDDDISNIDERAALAETLGGLGKPYELEGVEILLKSNWKVDLAIADNFRSAKGRVILAGDAAHQLSPIGGTGLNSGIQDALAIAWQLTAVLNGWGADNLLNAYDHERRMVGKQNATRVQQGLMDLLPMITYAMQNGAALQAEGPECETARATASQLIDKSKWTHEQEGTWADYRYDNSPITYPDGDTKPPGFNILKRTPSTWPGKFAPHVLLSDGTSIFDLYGADFTVVDFTASGKAADLFCEVAKSTKVPLKKVALPQEKHARQIWERDVVLVRPDGHVAWRSAAEGVDAVTLDAVKDVLAVATGWKVSPHYKVLDEMKVEPEPPVFD